MSRMNKMSDFFKSAYGKKYVKLAIDGGFTCPNRDGFLDTRGCIFCSERGSGEFTGDIKSGKVKGIAQQVNAQKELLKPKWSNKVGYLAYFQNYTNTYASKERLKALYDEAFSCDGIEGIVVATRPDCLDLSTIEVFKNQMQRGIFWVELGLQTIHPSSIHWMRRHYENDCFEKAMAALKEAGIPVVVHVIAGIPNETEAMFYETIAYVSKWQPFGIKIHMLNILKNTDLEKEFRLSPFKLLTEKEYVQWVTHAIALLDPNITIHRLTGDGEKEALIAPRWILNKRSVLNNIEKSLKQKNMTQGCLKRT